MIVKVTTGDRMAGLLAYLADVDPERTHNVHRDPRVIAGDPVTVPAPAALDRPGAVALAREVDAPRHLFPDVHVPGGHVFHASLSIAEGEGVLTDERWRQIAERFVAGMGFGDVRWLAVRHGTSRSGNDHAHVVVNLVREDGRAADTWRSWRRAQRVVGQIEREFGLRVLAGRANGRGRRGLSRAELERQARRAARLPERRALEAIVRTAAAAARDEDVFVHALRSAGVRVRARRDPETRRVTGYAVALDPVPGEPVVYFGGGRLARDLTLPALRQAHGWTDGGRSRLAGRGPDPPLRQAAEVARVIGGVLADAGGGSVEAMVEAVTRAVVATMEARWRQESAGAYLAGAYPPGVRPPAHPARGVGR